MCYCYILDLERHKELLLDFFHQHPSSGMSLWMYLLDVLYCLVKTELEYTLTVGLCFRDVFPVTIRKQQNLNLMLKGLCTLNRQVIHTDRSTHVALS